MKDQLKNESEEIELGFLFKTVSDFFRKVVKLLFLVIAFFQKYFIITLILVFVGVITGYFLDKNYSSDPTYENHVLVIPNFESVDYLYETIEGLNAKIASNDTIYLQSILGEDAALLRRIQIEPIVDIYNFATQSQQQIDVFRILFQNQELSDFVVDMTTSKYFKYHRMNFSIKGNSRSEEIVNKVLDFFSNNPHFKEYQEISKTNTALLIKESDNMMAQVDSLMKAAVTYANRRESNQSVFINDNSDLGALIYRKQDILDKRIDLLKQSRDEVAVIKKVSADYNILNKGLFSFSNKVKLPVQLIFLFSMIFFARFVYKSLKSFSEEG